MSTAQSFIALLALLILVRTQIADPLPSSNEKAPRWAIVSFVEKLHFEASENYSAPNYGGCVGPTMRARAMKRGAIDFLIKPVNDEDLLAAVRRVVAHDRRSRKARAELKSIQGRLATLTPQEREVLEHVVAGQLNEHIAGDLGTEKTIKEHRARVMRKILALSPKDVGLRSNIREGSAGQECGS